MDFTNAVIGDVQSQVLQKSIACSSQMTHVWTSIGSWTVLIFFLYFLSLVDWPCVHWLLDHKNTHIYDFMEGNVSKETRMGGSHAKDFIQQDLNPRSLGVQIPPQPWYFLNYWNFFKQGPTRAAFLDSFLQSFLQLRSQKMYWWKFELVHILLTKVCLHVPDHLSNGRVSRVALYHCF